MPIKKGSFVELEYYGIIKESGEVFDSSNEKIVIPVGFRLLPFGIDEVLIDKEENKEYYVKIPPELAFGPRKDELVKIIPIKYFRQNKIRPVPGLVINVDGLVGIIRTVSGGRVIVDFNHPYAGKEVVYYIRVYGIVEELEKQVEGLLKYLLKSEDLFSFKISEDKLDVLLKDVEKIDVNRLNRILKEVFKDKFKEIVISKEEKETQ